ncbi:MAG TPA: CPBP family intramembrane glutamic endopeptidase [Rhizomicrobium sp.]|jgi:membrane protease YdiL (CAAX protease family)|nr:CPBP family intramembrane glutamic endopeptidase [Rhizomicrobium sp.]
MNDLLRPGHSAFDLVLVVLALLVLPAISAVTGRRIAKAPEGSLLPRYFQTMTRGWFVVALIAVDWWWSSRPAVWLGLDYPVGENGIFGLVAAAAVAVAVAIQLSRGHRLVKPERLPQLRRQIRDIKILPHSSAEFAVFLAVAVTAGIWEELLYRGFLVWFLSPCAGVVAAVVLSTVVFGIGHVYQGWRGMLRSGALGLVFAVGYVGTGSLWWLIAIHGLIDIMGGIFAWRVASYPAASDAPA